MLYSPVQSNNVDNLRRADMDTPIDRLGICISIIFGVERILNKLSMLVYNHSGYIVGMMTLSLEEVKCGRYVRQS